MKSVIKAIVFLLVGITVIFYGGAYMLPGEARVERSTLIAAPPGRVFAIAADLRRLPDWSPWVATDPHTSFTFSGPEQGAGQAVHWASNNPMVGSGTMTLAVAIPGEKLVLSNDYGGFGTSETVMAFAADGAGTRVTWSFAAPLPGVVDRWAGLGMDHQVGAEYEEGLRNLKIMAEKQ